MTDQDTPTAQAQSSAYSGIHEIHAQESNRKYRLIDLDNTEMERTAAELFEGTRLLKNRDLWIANFAATIARVRSWCQEQAARLRSVYVDVRSNKVVFYLVSDSDRFDLTLDEAMTYLEVELGGSAGIGYVETLQIPERSLDRFVGPNSRTVWLRQ